MWAAANPDQFRETKKANPRVRIVQRTINLKNPMKTKQVTPSQQSKRETHDPVIEPAPSLSAFIQEPFEPCKKGVLKYPWP